MGRKVQDFLHVAVILGIVLIAVGLAIAAGMHGAMAMYGAAVMGLPSGCEDRRGQPLDRVAGEVPEHDGRSSGVRVEAHQVPVGATSAEVLDQSAAVVPSCRHQPSPVVSLVPLAVRVRIATADSADSSRRPLTAPLLRWSKRNRAASRTSPTSPP